MLLLEPVVYFPTSDVNFRSKILWKLSITVVPDIKLYISDTEIQDSQIRVYDENPFPSETVEIVNQPVYESGSDNVVLRRSIRSRKPYVVIKFL